MTTHDAAQIHDRLDPGMVPSCIVMNPPFSAAVGVETRVPDAAFRHLSSAVARLALGGRLVAITGANCSPEHKAWRDGFTSGPAYQDHNRIWAVLDKVLAKYPDMVLFHGGNPTGGEHIASLWARARKITHVPFRPDWERFKKAAPFRRNDQMLEALPKAVVACPGNGIKANLTDKARKMGISVWVIE